MVMVITTTNFTTTLQCSYQLWTPLPYDDSKYLRASLIRIILAVSTSDTVEEDFFLTEKIESLSIGDVKIYIRESNLIKLY